MKKETEEAKPKCEHMDTFPVDYFPATDWSGPYLIVQCDGYSRHFAVGGFELDGE